MAQYEHFRIMRYELHGGAEPTRVMAPISCNFLGWRNRSQFTVRVMTGETDQYDPLEPGGSEVIVVIPSGPKEIHPRFWEGDEVLQFQLESNNSADSGIVVVQFIF